ncbi:hypothetical protein VPH35_100403 [Triticum aestivum]
MKTRKLPWQVRIKNCHGRFISRIAVFCLRKLLCVRKTQRVENHNGTALTSHDDRDNFFHAAQLLREPFDRFLADHRTDAVVSDSFFHWSVDAAAERGVPRIGYNTKSNTFLGSSMFARACSDSMLRHNPLENAPDDPDALVLLPGLPHRVELRRSQMMDPAKMPWHWEFFNSMNVADQRSFGEVFNSFHELEPDYVEHFHKTLAQRVWLVGPVALASKDMAVRGTDAPSPDADSSIWWLDAKPAGSVVYVSFRTLTKFAPAELHQLARALDLSGVNFVWVIGAAAGQDSAEWMSEGFAELIVRGDRGFLVRGWAPQMLILSHAALGGFVTHCGWNLVLEAVTAGVPMVTWPRYADQFNNEKLVVELLKVGGNIGAKDYAPGIDAHKVIAGEVIAESIQRLMESDAIQKKAKDLGLKARSTVEKGESSYDDVGRLMDVLTACRSSVMIGEDIQAS